MSGVQQTAEDIVIGLLQTDGVDEFDLLFAMFDEIPDKIRDKIVSEIADRYELYTIDEARDSLADESHE